MSSAISTVPETLLCDDILPQERIELKKQHQQSSLDDVQNPDSHRSPRFDYTLTSEKEDNSWDELSKVHRASLARTIKLKGNQNSFDFSQFNSQFPPHHASRIRSSNASTTCIETIRSIIPPNKREVYIQLRNKKVISIQFGIVDQTHLTCGWLLSEAIRNIEEYNLTVNNTSDTPPPSNIVALISMNQDISLDYYLSQPDRSLQRIKDKQILQPYYGDQSVSFEQDQKITLRHFHVLIKIGQGGFSQVYLARRKDNGKFVALKVIEKKLIIKKRKKMYIYNEKNTMIALNESEFIVKLHFTFQTKKKLIFVTEYCAGGELFFHLQQVKRFREEAARFYFCEILVGFEELHSKGYLYRDLKPENILLDSDGHIRIADFGLSTFVQDKQKLNYTFCGSFEYMAPEMFSKSGHSFSLDFYTLGVLLYELVAGFPPFFSTEKTQIMEKVLKKEVRFPHHFSKELQSLVSQLLHKDPSKRLVTKNGVKEIQNHPWCKGVDFQAVKQKKLIPPLKPSIASLNFDREYINQPDKIDSLLEDVHQYDDFQQQQQYSREQNDSSESKLQPVSLIENSFDGFFLNNPLVIAATTFEQQLEQQNFLFKNNSFLSSRRPSENRFGQMNSWTSLNDSSQGSSFSSSIKASDLSHFSVDSASKQTNSRNRFLDFSFNGEKSSQLDGQIEGNQQQEQQYCTSFDREDSPKITFFGQKQIFFSCADTNLTPQKTKEKHILATNRNNNGYSYSDFKIPSLENSPEKKQTRNAFKEYSTNVPMYFSATNSNNNPFGIVSQTTSSKAESENINEITLSFGPKTKMKQIQKIIQQEKQQQQQKQSIKRQQQQQPLGRISQNIVPIDPDSSIDIDDSGDDMSIEKEFENHIYISRKDSSSSEQSSHSSIRKKIIF